MPKYRFKNFYEYWYALDGFQRSMLARMSGVSYNYLCRIARGDRQAGQQTITRLGKVDRTITPRLMRPDLAGKRKYVFKGRRVPRIHEREEGKNELRSVVDSTGISVYSAGTQAGPDTGPAGKAEAV